MTALNAREIDGWPSNHAANRDLPPTLGRDLALAEQLTIGVTKNALHLQWLTAHFAGRPLHKIDPIVQKIIAVALYQLRFLTRIPASAAVDQAVQQTRRFRRPGAAGFVNAILRNALRHPDVPLPDPSQDPLAYARDVLSHPPSLFAQLLNIADAPTALAIAAHNNAEPPLIVRLLPGASPAQLSAPDVRILSHERAGMFVVQNARREHLEHWAERRIAQVQDPTAAAVIDVCDIHPGQRVLDRCAGRGTKTRQLAERLSNADPLVAMDPDKSRLRSINDLIAQGSLRPILTCAGDQVSRLPADAPRQFERVLADVPCSNSGVLARRAEARYAQTDARLSSLATLQDEILDDTQNVVAPGGLLIYSTCSIWPEENHQCIERFLTRHNHFQLVEQKLTLPSTSSDPTTYHDGGFVAVLRNQKTGDS